MKNDQGDIGAGTLLAHAASHPEDHHGFVNPPIYRGSTVLFPSIDVMQSGKQRYQYGRGGNPSTAAFAEAISALEGAEGTVLCPSGLSACTTAILAVVGSGDHFLVPDSVYAPTRHFCDTAGRRLGFETTYYDPRIGNGISDLFRPNTKGVFVESPGSHTFEIQDIPAISDVAHERSALVIADNTWATPLFFEPLAAGADISVTAATKYVVGHSDALLGTVAAGPRAWEKVRALHSQLGLCAGSDDVNLALRGLRTMDVRLARHQHSALQIASWLEGREEVARVLYPALPSHPDYALWKRDFSGASGLLSFVTRAAPLSAVKAMLDDLSFFGLGYSWGGFESLANLVDLSDVRTSTKWEESGHLIRLHIGLEDPSDLIEDLIEGFERFRAAT
ncbi:cystathionine beta-lyase [Burkholderia lata]|uniref:cystathionine beta-lyase n=1 Tax=Burkholderia lata (strain ATCC 17760 / DSM 23089 / LMG 22485 / NCIMB 9086 / R18194 / 383) TaxID=482957 RepID=UPI00145409E4|nr:cystathionine beta-lyase [Burkholderia lata]VWB87565.1 Cystathionine beta-lyase [Burkholderia lata]